MRFTPAVFFPLLLSSSAVTAQHAASVLAVDAQADAVQLFSSIDRPVASVGESVIMTVELLASPKTEEEGALLRRTFAALRPDLPEDDIERVRSYKPNERLEKLDAWPETEKLLPVLHLKRRFVIRPRRDGLMEIPGFTLSFRGREFSTEVHQLHAYKLEVDFLKAQRAVLPLVVESRIKGKQLRKFMGTGSAFLVAEDALVTAYHVVVNAHRITTTLPNGRRVKIKKMWSVDSERDVAVLYIDPDEVRRAGIEPLVVAPRRPVTPSNQDLDSDRIVFTLGWPDALQQSGAGVLFSSNQFYDDDAIWLSSNRVRPGDSGGPLIDRKGQVVGVVSYGMSSGPDRSQILDNVATATDPRPALIERLVSDRPSGLRAFRDEDFFDRDPQARAVKAMSLLTEYVHLRRLGDQTVVRSFLEELDHAITQSYGVPRLHFLQGSIYQMLGNFPRAGDAYQRALFQRSEHYPAAYSLAYCHLAERSYDVAAELFDFTTHFEPYRDLAEYGLAQAKMQLVRYDEAIHHLRRIVHRHDDFAPAIYLLGRAYLGKGNQAAAGRILVKLKEMSPAWGELLERSMRLIPFRPVVRGVMRHADIDRID